MGPSGDELSACCTGRVEVPEAEAVQEAVAVLRFQRGSPHKFRRVVDG